MEWVYRSFFIMEALTIEVHYMWCQRPPPPNNEVHGAILLGYFGIAEVL